MPTDSLSTVAASGSVALGRVVCGIDGSRAAAAAVEQALAIADPHASVLLVAVTDERGGGMSAMATLGSTRATKALDATRRELRRLGVRVSTELAHGDDPAAALAERAGGHDLLAIGPPVGSRASGIFFGATATRLLHRCSVPVLVARPPRDPDRRFPSHVIVATDGSAGSDRAVALAARIAAGRPIDVDLLHAGFEPPDAQRRRIAEQTVALEQATGRRPALADASGDAADAIVHDAASRGADLVVVGSRGLTGVRALGSVSERVAHRSPCSVLVAR